MTTRTDPLGPHTPPLPEPFFQVDRVNGIQVSLGDRPWGRATEWLTSEQARKLAGQLLAAADDYDGSTR